MLFTPKDLERWEKICAELKDAPATVEAENLDADMKDEDDSDELGLRLEGLFAAGTFDQMVAFFSKNKERVSLLEETAYDRDNTTWLELRFRPKMLCLLFHLNGILPKRVDDMLDELAGQVASPLHSAESMQLITEYMISAYIDGSAVDPKLTTQNVCILLLGRLASKCEEVKAFPSVAALKWIYEKAGRPHLLSNQVVQLAAAEAYQDSDDVVIEKGRFISPKGKIMPWSCCGVTMDVLGQDRVKDALLANTEEEPSQDS